MNASPPSRPLAVIGAATSAGAYGPGQERAPEALRRHGLLDALGRSRRAVHEIGDVIAIRHRLDPSNPEAANVAQVRAAIERVAESVAAALSRGEDVLVLGGDCTVELGTVAGAVADGSSVGLVYVDLDADLNTPATGDGVLDWMGLAHLLNIPGVLPEIAEAGHRTPLLPPEAVFLVGADNLTAPERRIINEFNLRLAPLAAVKDDPYAVLQDLTQWAIGFDRVLVHVDIDVLHYPDFPIAHEIRDAPGLTIDELDKLTAQLRQLPGWAGLTICEINPDHATDENQQFARLIELLKRSA